MYYNDRKNFFHESNKEKNIEVRAIFKQKAFFFILFDFQDKTRRNKLTEIIVSGQT